MDNVTFASNTQRGVRLHSLYGPVMQAVVAGLPWLTHRADSTS